MDAETLHAARGDQVVVQAGDQKTCLLLVSGKPIEEPVAVGWSDRDEYRAGPPAAVREPATTLVQERSDRSMDPSFAA